MQDSTLYPSKLTRFMSFEQWLAANPELAESQEPCPNCDGDGWKFCEHCGSEMDCEFCKGKGKVSNARKLYDEQRQRDEERLKRYNARMAEVAA